MKNKASYSSVPYIIWSIIFTVVPLGMVLYFALTQKDGGSFTVDNFGKVLDYLPKIGYSIFIGALATLICLVLGYPVAYLISRASGVAQQTMVMLIMLPQWMNFLLRTYAWRTLLEGEGILGFLGLINTPSAVVLGMVYNFLPFMILPIYTVMVKIDKSTIEAAQDLGASGREVLRRVILPLSMPGILSGITMVFVPALSTFALSKILGGGKDMMVGDLIEFYAVGTGGNINIAAAISFVLMILMFISMYFMNKFDETDEMGGLVV